MFNVGLAVTWGVKVPVGKCIYIARKAVDVYFYRVRYKFVISSASPSLPTKTCLTTVISVDTATTTMKCAMTTTIMKLILVSSIMSPITLSNTTAAISTSDIMADTMKSIARPITTAIMGDITDIID
uniref:Uncharacterized protein n=1 Tax=Plectus sambesii TaxID=2011161 RepID=A0A914XCI8_9BILA